MWLPTSLVGLPVPYPRRYEFALTCPVSQVVPGEYKIVVSAPQMGLGYLYAPPVHSVSTPELWPRLCYCQIVRSDCADPPEIGLSPFSRLMYKTPLANVMSRHTLQVACVTKPSVAC